MRTAIAAAVVLLVASTFAHAQFDRSERVGLKVDLAARHLDVVSTRLMLDRGGHEFFLPDWLSHHPSVMSAYGSSVVAIDRLIVQKLNAHGHRRLAQTWVWIDAGQDAFWATRNLWVHGHPALGLPK